MFPFPFQPNITNLKGAAMNFELLDITFIAVP